MNRFDPTVRPDLLRYAVSIIRGVDAATRTRIARADLALTKRDRVGVLRPQLTDQVA